MFPAMLNVMSQEIISGKVPFHGLKRGQVIMEILSGQVPKRSTVDKSHIEGLDEIWSVCTWCWATNPADRPTMDVVLKRLNVSTLWPNM